jgi:hypothetical protein
MMMPPQTQPRRSDAIPNRLLATARSFYVFVAKEFLISHNTVPFPFSYTRSFELGLLVAIAKSDFYSKNNSTFLDSSRLHRLALSFGFPV